MQGSVFLKGKVAAETVQILKPSQILQRCRFDVEISPDDFQMGKAVQVFYRRSPRQRALPDRNRPFDHPASWVGQRKKVNLALFGVKNLVRTGRRRGGAGAWIVEKQFVDDARVELIAQGQRHLARRGGTALRQQKHLRERVKTNVCFIEGTRRQAEAGVQTVKILLGYAFVERRCEFDADMIVCRVGRRTGIVATGFPLGDTDTGRRGG